MDGVVIGMTTIPERLAAGLPDRAVRSLLAGEPHQQPRAVVVTVPMQTRDGRVYDEAAVQRLREVDPRVIVHRLPVDDGSLSKLTGLLEAVDTVPGLADCQFLALGDDDIVYQPGSFEVLVRTAHVRGFRAVGYAGRNGDSRLSYVMGREAQVPFLETVAGVVYSRRAFDGAASMRAWLHMLPDDAMFVDDIVIGAWLQHRGVPRYTQGAMFRGVIDPGDTPKLYIGNVLGRRNEQLLPQQYKTRHHL